MSAERYCRLYERFKHVADFAAVYVQEAHATDGWKFSNNVCYRYPRNIFQRWKIAQDFIDQRSFTAPLYIDLMDNNTASAYDALPERLYIIENGRIVYQGGPGPFEYYLQDIEEWLEKRFKHVA